MDRFFFEKLLNSGVCVVKTEETEYLEVLNYSDPLYHTSKWQGLSSKNADDFHDFLSRKGEFAPPTLPEAVSFSNGLRLMLQPKAQNPTTFEPHTIPFPKPQYKALMAEMQLPLRSLEASSAVGPFFWWTTTNTTPGTSTTTTTTAAPPNEKTPRLFQLIFRKSDGTSNKSTGWEMTLSHSFSTKITSGFVKATGKSGLDKDILPDLQKCSFPQTHPLLLPSLMLYKVLSSTNDNNQRNLREKIRKLEYALSARYRDKTKTGRAESYAAEQRDLELDMRELTACYCEVMWKRPQAWLSVVRRMQEAARGFWDNLPEDDHCALEELHECIVSRLEFVQMKLEGLESYTHVSLERLTLQREVMHGIIDHRESRLNLEIAVQQQMLADSTRRDGMSMKTLTLVGALFLPGTFLSSMFSMPFFDFSGDMNGSVSKSLWIYFVLLIPVTVVVLGAWLFFDKKSKTVTQQDFEAAEDRMHDLESRIIDRIKKKTGVRVTVMDLGSSEQQDSPPSGRW
ncbi:hypothetical protein QBC44DRAFT_332659 [Cladorrhinum sp. PSN332]|nr:hypothetical protein QBC44DRAFT_332659 [Cladorrhinum sp. PSN332]